jgi:hypothetical protein
MLVLTCDPISMGWEDVRNTNSEILSQNKPGMMVHVYNPSYVGSRGRRIVV